MCSKYWSSRGWETHGCGFSVRLSPNDREWVVGCMTIKWTSIMKISQGSLLYGRNLWQFTMVHCQAFASCCRSARAKQSLICRGTSSAPRCLFRAWWNQCILFYLHWSSLNPLTVCSKTRSLSVISLLTSIKRACRRLYSEPVHLDRVLRERGDLSTAVQNILLHSVFVDRASGAALGGRIHGTPLGVQWFYT